ncbi:hypothetical protein EV144_101183 [Flavobacterium sp. 270]|uniref:hypothetical protein n=1 Tax=Flavobacterium sp. 270 TaxID=2512114 RepID=UPI00106532BE|nr:hypothetical protein [Flavobacterium sp. 270]TDW51508.1 hypothetical protein EV144_101183 [Flavobacterium sp. 270]
MIKKILTPSTIAIFFWGIGLLIVNEKFYEYLRTYLYLSIIIAVACIIFDNIKKKKESKDQ